MVSRWSRHRTPDGSPAGAQPASFSPSRRWKRKSRPSPLITHSYKSPSSLSSAPLLPSSFFCGLSASCFTRSLRPTCPRPCRCLPTLPESPPSLVHRPSPALAASCNLSNVETAMSINPWEAYALEVGVCHGSWGRRRGAEALMAEDSITSPAARAARATGPRNIPPPAIPSSIPGCTARAAST